MQAKHKIKQISKILTFSSLAIGAITGIIIYGAHHHSASAANSANVDFSATIAESLNITVPVSTVTLNLNPVTQNLATQTVPVTVGTNNEAGYTLTMTAVSTSLTRDDSDGISATIDTLEPSDSGYTTANFMPNRWGYSKNGGNFFPFATSTELASSDAKVNDDTTTLAFAAKADYTKPAGEYSLDLTFTATANPNLTYIQDFTNEQCQNLASSDNCIVYDKRDGNDYTVRYINGNCWMTQNLRFSGSHIEPTMTNINVEKDITWTDLTLGNTRDMARYHDSGNAANGFWYNYAGASAMTVAGSSSTAEASYNICPSGWGLPSLSEFRDIANNAIAQSTFAIAGGYYTNGDVRDTSTGYWWASTAYDAYNRFGLKNTGGSLVTNNDGFNCAYGFYVRCIHGN